MSDDPNRKSVRQFQCRDYLWDTFEGMSQELQCSVDYLINEAMRHYARSQGKGVAGPAPGPPSAPPGRPTPGPSVAPGPMQGLGGPRAMPGMAPQAPRGPGAMPPPAASLGARPMAPGGGPVPRPPVSGVGGRPMAPAGPTGSVLFAVFEGQRYPIAKDEFFIGRSNKSCDLVLKDPNVSRQHARVVRHQGQYWMVDMGSTNGIEYNAGRVERRPIQEGDLFRICDHEIAFTYRT
jgi:hypothetical protein